MKKIFALVVILVFVALDLSFSQSASLVPDSALSEQSLYVRTLHIKLGDSETFITTPPLAPGDFTLVDFPTGITVQDVLYSSAETL